MQYAMTNAVVFQVIHHVSSISLENIHEYVQARINPEFCTFTCSLEVTAQKTISAKF